MSTGTKPVWRTAAAHKEDDFDAIWLYENAWEWTFSEENGVVTLHYLSSKVMPERNGASPVSQEKSITDIRYDAFMGGRIEPRVQWDRNRLYALAGVMPPMRLDELAQKILDIVRQASTSAEAKDAEEEFAGRGYGILFDALENIEKLCQEQLQKGST